MTDFTALYPALYDPFSEATVDVLRQLRGPSLLTPQEVTDYVARVKKEIAMQADVAAVE